MCRLSGTGNQHMGSWMGQCFSAVQDRRGQLFKIEGIDWSVHFSSTSCLWPGFVLSATVFENNDMNWP